MSDYIFPELPHYKREWVPILEAAKLTLDQEDYLCRAVIEAAMVCETRYVGVEWQELGYSIVAAIYKSLGRHMTVSTWYWHTFGKPISGHEGYRKEAKCYKAYRLAWLDHIIKECEKCL